MSGENIGRLNVYLQDALGPQELVWRIVGDQGEEWKSAVIPLSRTRPFKVFQLSLNCMQRPQRVMVVTIGQIYLP